MLNEILVGNQKIDDGVVTKARGFKEGGTSVGHIHGKYYEASLRGNVFMAYTVIAGVALPTAAATLNSKFTLHNPAGSGKNVELISFTMGIDSATMVVNGVGLAIQRNLTTTSGVPTTTTSLVSSSLGPVGTATTVAYSQATLTNVAIPGVTAATAVPIPFYNMFSFGATTGPGIFDATHNFDGRVILGPDTLVAACTTVAPATAAFCGIIWAEWQV
jgi:hypothetical protein